MKTFIKTNILRALRIFLLTSAIWFGFKLIPITYTFDIEGGISPYKDFSLIRTALAVADFNDNVHISINSPGGSVAIGMTLINSIVTSDATVITHNHTYAASMGALLALSGDVITANPYSEYLFHLAYYMDKKGKKHQVRDGFWVNPMMRYFEDNIKPLLTPSELDDFFNGKDVVISGKEILERVKNGQ